MFGGGGGFGGFGQNNQNNNNNQQQGAGLFGAGNTSNAFGQTQPTPFGQPQNQQANTGGGLFGAQPQAQPAQSSGFTFGQSTNQAQSQAPVFGQQPKPTGFGGFGATTGGNNTGGGFTFGGTSAQAQPQSTPVFGGGGFGTQQNKPAGGLFGTAPSQPTAGAFGAQPQQQAGGLFGTQTGGMPTQGSSNPPYQLTPVLDDAKEKITINGRQEERDVYHEAQCITYMPAYANMSVEEIRVQDYQQNRKTGPGGPQTGAGGFAFGQQPAQTNTGFGQSTSGGLFGNNNAQQQNNPFGASQSNTGGLFGNQQQQPQQTGGLFGQQPQQQQGGLFGSSTSSQPAQSGGLFGQQPQTQPAQSTGFSFGQNNNTNNQAGSSTAGGFSFGGAQQNQTQNKSLFGGFGQSTTQPAQQPSQPFSFGGQQQQQQPAAGAFGGASTSSNTGGLSFGAASNAPKPGGLFGTATSQPPATSAAPAFGGFGAQTNNAPKPGGFTFGSGFGTSGASTTQTSAPAQTGGLFGGSQSTTTSQPTGGLFGNNTTQAPATGGFSFGQPQQQQQQQPAATGFGGGGLFGAKPATGGLFGSTTQQTGQQNQPASTGFGGGGLFGANNNNNAAKPGGFSFGATTNNQTQGGGGLFGSNPAAGGSSLFGASQPAASTGGFSFGNSTNTGGGGLFGQSQNNNQQNQNQFQQSQNQPQQGQFQQPGLDRDPYGTDALFAQNGGVAPGQGPTIPFHLTQKKKKQPPLVVPFRSSPSNAGKITRLRGMTPSGGLGSSVSGGRSGTPGRETTPGASLFAGASVYGRSSSPALFRGFSDEQSIISPNAFVSRSSVKRLDLDPPGSTSTAGGGLGASRSMFGPRAGSVLDGSPGGGNNSFSRGGTAPITHRGVAFSPAAESASRIRQNSVLNGNLQSQNQNDPDNSFASSIAPRRGQLFSDQLPEQPLRRKELEMNQITSSTPLVNPQRKTSMPLNNANSLVNSPNTSIGGGNLGGDDSQDGKGGYYMEPSYNALRNLANDDLKEVENFVVGRKGFGKITFLKVDLSEGPKLAQIAGGVVQIRAKEVYVYPSPEDSEARNDDPPIQKAPPGKGLNVPAVVSLEKCWAVDRETREPIKDPEHIKVKHFEIRLKKREDTDFISYEATTGTWTFKVDHFSRYGLDGLDESDEGEDEELINDIASGARSAAASRSSGSRTTRSSKRFVSESEEDEDEDAPPTRRMDEASSSSQTEDEDELQSPSEMSEEMRESELGDGIPDSQKVWKQFDTVPINSTPRVNNRINRERSSTPRGGSGLSPATSRRGERGTSQTPQPWAATLGLEARRVQVMQASFFGQEKEKEVVRNNASTIPSSSIVPPPSLSKNNNQNQRKHPLSTSSSQKRLENLASGSAAQRQNFSSPIRTTNQNQISNNDPSSDLIIPPARKLNRSDLAQSVVKGSDGIFVDAGLALGRSFRVGWGPDGSIVHNGKLVGASAGASFVDSARAQASSSKSIPSQSLSTLKIQKLKIFKHGSEQEVNKADRLLQCQLAQSVILYDTDSECPEIRPHEEVRFSNFSAAFERDDRSQEASLWRLGMALFDEIDLKLADNTPEDVVERVKSLRRKAALSAWLSHTVSSTVEIESRSHVAASRDEALVFSYLTGHQLERACSSALDSGNLRLATLLAQIGGGDSTFRQDINEQLSTWRTEGVDAHITKDHRRIYELLAGNVTLSQGTASRSVREAIDQVGDLQIAGGLDWKRALGLHLWYEVPASASLIAAFERYEKAIGGPGGTAPPLPPYRESASVGSLARQKIIQSGDYDKDALYHLIKLYAQPTHDLESALDPHSFGPDSADYRLPWHLYCLLSSVLGVRDFWDRPDIGEDEETQYGSRADGLTSSYAAQLELQGQWTWSAFVLLHLQLSDSREKAIKSLLNRNVSSLNQESEDFLSQKLSIPLEWIYESKAIEAKSRDAKWEEYELWLKAKQWEQAHIVARDYLAPEALSRGETTLLTQMFAPLPLDDGAHGGKDEKGELPGWRSGGRVYVDYAFCKKNALKITKAWKLSDGKNERINNEVENMSKIVGELLELTPGLFNDVENNISHAMARSDMLVSLHTIAREISACLPPSAPEPVVTWDKVSKPEVEAVQNTADDYLNLLVGTS